jgi:hypothetical protein
VRTKIARCPVCGEKMPPGYERFVSAQNLGGFHVCVECKTLADLCVWQDHGGELLALMIRARSDRRRR